jgi:hypothetical protein
MTEFVKENAMMEKELFDKFPGEAVFLKQTGVPGGKLQDSAQKAFLNRKGNMLFNSGDAEAARRIFITTGYSDGLSRIGDYYKESGRALDALRMYWIAPDKKKADQIILELSILIKSLIHEGQEKNER